MKWWICLLLAIGVSVFVYLSSSSRADYVTFWLYEPLTPAARMQTGLGVGGFCLLALMDILLSFRLSMAQKVIAGLTGVMAVSIIAVVVLLQAGVMR